jgi:protein-disulfide isomerase
MPYASTSRRDPSWAVPTAVGVLAAALIAAILWSTTLRSDPDAGAATSQEPTTDFQAVPAPEGTPQDAPPTTVDEPSQGGLADAERRAPDDPLAIGPVDAPVVLVVFSDYQCSYCAKWSAETLPVMMDYVDDGDLRIEWRDVNIYGSDSERAARAAYAAALQGQFWEFHDELYPEGKLRSPGELSEDSMVKIAEQLSLDLERFRADLDAEATVAEVLRNQQLGIELGAFSTPSFVMAGQPLVGALPTEVFVEAFQQVLTSATR